ncbi:MAG: alcohol dehydrogenase catalytic domain-containing protein [Synergistaceae bacterium]|jgi:L-iditol 2-dehydrogenase|nr:alcohol dehydrogenase catalytic domain-containing protein [Synergistaceae bacterium]
MKLRKENGAVEVVDIEKTAGPADDEVLLRVHSAAVCGSDVHAYEYIPSYQAFMKVPIVLGHEGAGVVEARGRNVTQFKPGDRVMGESNIYCGHCRNCHLGLTNICDKNLMRGLTTTGVMQEYALFNEKNLHLVPTALSFDEGAAAQACTVSAHGVLHRVSVNAGDNVVVMGAGIIGIVAAQLARLKGGNALLVGTDDDEAARLPIARKMGFQTVNCQKEDVAVYAEKLFGRKADFTLECSGAASAVVSAVDATKKGGTILLLGLVGKDVPFPFAKATRLEINIITSYTSTWIDYEETLAFLASGALDIKPLLSVYPVQEGVKAFEDAVSKKALKPVIRFL